MNPAEVIAIEVKQYLGADGTKTLVPRVIGETAEVEARKGRRTSGGRRQWDEESLFADLTAKSGEQEAQVARDLYDWVCARGWRPTFGQGKQDGSWIPVLDANGHQHYPIALYSYGRIELQFQHLKARAPFDDEQTRLELLRRINEIPGVYFGPDVVTKRPSIPLGLLAGDPAALDQLTRVLEWIEHYANAGPQQWIARRYESD
jgi:hypothetical protein